VTNIVLKMMLAVGLIAAWALAETPQTLDQAKALATAQGKFILMEFYTTW